MASLLEVAEFGQIKRKSVLVLVRLFGKKQLLLKHKSGVFYSKQFAPFKICLLL